MRHTPEGVSPAENGETDVVTHAKLLVDDSLSDEIVIKGADNAARPEVGISMKKQGMRRNTIYTSQIVPIPIILFKRFTSMRANNEKGDRRPAC